MTWLSAAELADLAGVSQQAARKAIRTAKWHGSALDVRQVAGRCGKAGRSLQVRLDSLPSDVQSRFNDRFN